MSEPKGTLAGASYPVGAKWLASVMLAGLVASLGLAWEQIPWADLPGEAWWALVGVAAMVAWGYLKVLMSRTVVTDTSISEGWLTYSEVQLHDITHVKWLHWKWAEPVMAPRLVLRVKGRGTVTFHAADPAVRDRCRWLALGDE